MILWGLHNEIYSNSEEIHKKGENYGTVLTRDLHDLAKRMDPYRPTVTVDNGDMNRPVNKQASVQGFNRYYGWYGGTMNGIKKWVEEYQTKYPDYAVVLAEYGAGGNMAHQEEVVPESTFRNPMRPDFTKPSGETLPISSISSLLMYGICLILAYLFGLEGESPLGITKDW